MFHYQTQVSSVDLDELMVHYICRKLWDSIFSYKSGSNEVNYLVLNTTHQSSLEHELFVHPQTPETTSAKWWELIVSAQLV